MYRRLLACAALGIPAISGVHAETVYKCQAAGQTIYQQTPCAKNQSQQRIELQDSAPANGVAPMPVPSPATATDATADNASAPQAFPPPPRMFGCVRATDGKSYTSSNGNPEPYMAPIGVMGGLGATLSDTYGNPDSAVASAPELNRGKGNVAGIATTNYVWVQDRCRLLSPAETCQALRGDAESNQRQIRNAFKSERAPLDSREAQLRQQLQGCG